MAAVAAGRDPQGHALPIRHVILTHYHADQRRLETSRDELRPWIDAATRLVPADRWIEGDTDLRIGGTEIRIRHVGPAHMPEDVVVFVPQAGALFTGDLVFRGRISYVGQADSRKWIASLERLLALNARVMLPGHGPASNATHQDIELTRDYLRFLRESMREAAVNLEPFDAAYARTDWSRFEGLPLFRAANRMNAYNTCLLLQG